MNPHPQESRPQNITVWNMYRERIDQSRFSTNCTIKRQSRISWNSQWTFALIVVYKPVARISRYVRCSITTHQELKQANLVDRRYYTPPHPCFKFLGVVPSVCVRQLRFCAQNHSMERKFFLRTRMRIRIYGDSVTSFPSSGFLLR